MTQEKPLHFYSVERVEHTSLEISGSPVIPSHRQATVPGVKTSTTALAMFLMKRIDSVCELTQQMVETNRLKAMVHPDITLEIAEILPTQTGHLNPVIKTGI